MGRCINTQIGTWEDRKTDTCEYIQTDMQTGNCIDTQIRTWVERQVDSHIETGGQVGRNTHI